MVRQILRNKVVVGVVSLVVIGTFILSNATMGYALRPKSATNDAERLDDVAKMFGYGFNSQPGVNLAHDKVFRAKADLAFAEGRAPSIFGHNTKFIQASGFGYEGLLNVAAEFLKKSGEVGISEQELAERLGRAQGFLNNVFSAEFIDKVVAEVAKIDEAGVQKDVEKAKQAYAKAKAGLIKAKEAPEINKAKGTLESAAGLVYKTEKAREFLRMIKKIAAIEDTTTRQQAARKAIVDDTRFVTFIFGSKGLDPFLVSLGDILSEEYRALVAHIGTFSYAGSENIEGGPRTIYTTLARITGFEARGDEGTRMYQEMMLHEFMDRAYGKHVNPPVKVITALNEINKQIDAEYKVKLDVATEVLEKGSVVVSTPKVKIEKSRLISDLGTKRVFAIQGSSKVHPDVIKGSGKKITVTIAKADVGSIGGHGTVDETQLEAVAEEWMKAAEQGLILDFFITRTGDDISVTVTHIKGKDNEQIHRLIWDGFVRGGVIAEDMGYYAAGQDLLANAFSGNVRGAGPSVAEMEFEEAGKEVLIIAQADKTAPGAFNKGLWEILFSPNTTWRPLGKGQAQKIKVGVLDFEHNKKVGRHIWLGKEDYDTAAWYLGYPDRYTIDNVTLGTGEDMAAVTAQRLGLIAGEYVGKDDPMFMMRSQSAFPAVGEITAPFLKDEYIVPGWMRGSNKGPFLPVALQDAKIGIYDGPPLLTMWSFNITNGRLVGFYDLMAANPAIRHIQDTRTAAAVRNLREGFGAGSEMTLRLNETEIEYQAGVEMREKELAGRWEEFSSKEEKATVAVEEQIEADNIFQHVALKVAEEKTRAQRLELFKAKWGEKLVPFAEAFAPDIHNELSAKLVVLNQIDKAEVYPILFNHESLLKSSPDGIMAFLNAFEQLGKGNIKPILHIARDDIKPEELDAVVDDTLDKVNNINSGPTKISRDMFAAVVVGTNPEDVAKQVKEKVGAGIYQVIGPAEYAVQFKGVMQIVMDKANKGQITPMSKALKLSLALIPAEGKLTNEQLKKLDALFSVDEGGNFHVASTDVTTSVSNAAEEYARQVEAIDIRV